MKPRIENIPDMIYCQKDSGLLGVYAMCLPFSFEFYKHKRGIIGRSYSSIGSFLRPCLKCVYLVAKLLKLKPWLVDALLL